MIGGPFETEQQARELPGGAGRLRSVLHRSRRGPMTPHTHKILISAVRSGWRGARRLRPRRILLFLGGWGSATRAVVAGLTSRAHDAGLTLPVQSAISASLPLPQMSLTRTGRRSQAPVVFDMNIFSLANGIISFANGYDFQYAQ